MVERTEVKPGVVDAALEAVGKVEPLSLGARLVKAQGIAQAVAKESFNAYQKYRYASSEAVIEEARGALNQAGIALFARDWCFNALVPLPEMGHVGKMVVTYFLTDGFQEMRMSAETAVIVDKGRPLDKAQATALTYNLAYFLRSLLLLPREDESESVDARDDRHQDRPAMRPSAPQPQEEPSYTAAQIAELHTEIKALGKDLGLEGAPLHRKLLGLAGGKPYSNSYPLLCVIRDKLKEEPPKP